MGIGIEDVTAIGLLSHDAIDDGPVAGRVTDRGTSGPQSSPIDNGDLGKVVIVREFVIEPGQSHARILRGAGHRHRCDVVKGSLWT